MYNSLFPGDASDFSENVFRTFDANGDDKVDFREFIVGLSQSGSSDLQTQIDWAFRMYDINRDGYISWDEMRHIISVSHFITVNLHKERWQPSCFFISVNVQNERKQIQPLLCKLTLTVKPVENGILQCFRTSLSYHLLLRSLFCLFLSDRRTQVLLYIPFKITLSNIYNAKC